MATKSENILDPQSCWNRAEDGEPVFILRANDFEAPAVVISWAQRYLIRKNGWANMTLTQREKYAQALAVARDMRDWRAKKDEDDIPF